MKRLKLKTKILKNLICYHMTCINPKKSLSDDVSSLNLMILTDVLLYLFVLYPYRCPVRCRRSTTSISNSPRRRHQLGFAIKPIFSPSPSPAMAAGHNYQPSTTFRLQILNFKSWSWVWVGGKRWENELATVAEDVLGLPRKLPGNEDADTEAIAFAIYGMKLFYCAAPKTSHNYTSSPGVGSQPQPWCHCKLLTHVHHCHLQRLRSILQKQWIPLWNFLQRAFLPPFKGNHGTRK